MARECSQPGGHPEGISTTRRDLAAVGVKAMFVIVELDSKKALCEDAGL
jgi:hypothetical protein